MNLIPQYCFGVPQSTQTPALRGAFHPANFGSLIRIFQLPQYPIHRDDDGDDDGMAVILC